jgi:hypothetical protein
MKYNGKEITLKFDNLTSFNFIVGGVSVSDLLITEKSDINRFCKAWSCLLNVKFNGDARAFMNGFGERLDALAINNAVIEMLERDGVIPKEKSSAKKKPKKN